MSQRFLRVSLAALIGLLAAGSGHAQLSLRGDYAAARGVTEVSALYARQTKQAIVVTPFSTNAGIQGVLAGSVDVAVSARPPVAQRTDEANLVFWPVAWDAVVFIVHPSNPVRNLSMAQVRDIFQGRLSNWTEVGGKAAPIDLYAVMGPYDGIESSMRQILFANPGYNAKIKRLFLNQHQIEVGIQMDPDAIGMTTLGGLNRQRVRALSIEGITPDKDTVAAGSYLLTVPLYLVYRADHARVAEITRFTEFLRTPIAQNVLTGKRLLPHRDDDSFRTLHTQRLATLWQSLGGQPAAPGTVRFTGQAGAATVKADSQAHPNPTTVAATPVSRTTGTSRVSDASRVAAAAAAAAATPAATGVTRTAAPAVTTQPNGQHASATTTATTSTQPAPRVGTGTAPAAAGVSAAAPAAAASPCRKTSPTDKC